MLQVIYSGADGRTYETFRKNWEEVYLYRPAWAVRIDVALS